MRQLQSNFSIIIIRVMLLTHSIVRTIIQILPRWCVGPCDGVWGPHTSCERICTLACTSVCNCTIYLIIMLWWPHLDIKFLEQNHLMCTLTLVNRPHQSCLIPMHLVTLRWYPKCGVTKCGNHSIFFMSKKPGHGCAYGYIYKHWT